MMTPKMKISTARYLAMSATPYFSAMLYKITFKEVPPGTLPFPTLAVSNRAVCVYERAFVEQVTEKQLAAVIIHEINHLVRHHAKRMGTRDPKKWNLAGDAEINDDLQAMRLPLPGVPFVPESVPAPRGLTAEEYYAKLEEQQNEDDNKDGTGGVGSGGCGGCSGHGDDGEQEGEGEQDGGRSEAEMEMTRDQVAQAVQSEAQRGRGNVPAGLRKWAGERLTPPRVPWETKLARACRRLVNSRPGAVDYRFSRLSRRQAGVGYGPGKPILPGLVEPVPAVAVGLDTSGSMGEKEILLAARETAGIMRAVGVGITFLACDAKVHEIKQVHSPSQLAACIKGGGGTDFHPLFHAVDKLTPRPEVLVFITDGCGPAPVHPPKGVSVIWLLAGRYRRKPWVTHDPNHYDAHMPEVPYGVFIEMDE